MIEHHHHLQKSVLYKDTDYMARISYFLMALPLAIPFGLAPIFLGAGFLATDFLAAGFLAKDAFLVADFFTAEVFFAGALTLPAFLTVFLAIFLGALEPTFPEFDFCCAFSFLATALWATVLRSFSSAESLKQPEPFLPAGAPGTSTPPSRIFFSTLFRAPAFWLTSILYLLLKWFLMAEREDPSLSFCVTIASTTISLYRGLMEAPPLFGTAPFDFFLIFAAFVFAGSTSGAGTATAS